MITAGVATGEGGWEEGEGKEGGRKGGKRGGGCREWGEKGEVMEDGWREARNQRKERGCISYICTDCPFF